MTRALDDALDQGFHDWEIYAYEHATDVQELVLHLERGGRHGAGEFVDLEFCGVVVADLQQAFTQNVVSELHEIECAEFMQRYPGWLEPERGYALPVAADEPDLAVWLARSALRPFVLEPCVGLHGLVVAKSVAPVPRARRWTRSSANA